MEHSFFERRIYKKSLPLCHTCNQKFKEKHESYYHCKDCSIIVHSKCLAITKRDCKPKQSNNLDEDIERQDSVESLTSPMSPVIKSNDMPTFSEIKTIPEDATTFTAAQKDSSSSRKDEDNIAPLPTYTRNNRFTAKNGTNKQIKLMRMSQRVQKKGDSFWKGNMVYSTSQNNELIAKYWQLDSQAINVFETSRMDKKLFDITLDTIKRIELNISAQNNQARLRNRTSSEQSHPYVFSIRTENMTYFCGLALNEDSHSLSQNTRGFYNILKMAYLPFVKGHRKSLKITAPKFEAKDVTEDYQLNVNDLLGSGQFGQVYGGFCKVSNQPVAIKIIDKARFQDINTETSIFQNEVTILYNMKHPGIVKLFALYDNSENLCIVTEKMSLDMLEMILNRKPSRLNERVTKFLVFQILVALDFLHKRDIAHCDLKPENILLTRNEEFPHIKICDFGFAKIIGENSFRRSIVGTPAYSPPEVKQRKTFNKSMDIWSVGVIMYVSLSGVFPFDEDRDIYEQIINASIMFPDDPWASISEEAISLISNEFLHVSLDRRAIISKALRHSWFSEDYQLYCDLNELEHRVNEKWLITKDIEEKWESSNL